MYVGKYKRGVSREGRKILTELVFYFCQSVNPVQSQPKFSVQVIKPILAIGQATVEFNQAIQSLLKHRPPPLPPNRIGCCCCSKKTSKAPEPSGPIVQTPVFVFSFLDDADILNVWKLFVHFLKKCFDLLVRRA